MNQLAQKVSSVPSSSDDCDVAQRRLHAKPVYPSALSSLEVAAENNGALMAEVKGHH